LKERCFHPWVIGIVAVLAACLAGAAWGLTICGACGYEAAEGATVCDHCKARLPAPAVAAATSDVAAAFSAGAADTNLAGSAFAAARADVQWARERQVERPAAALAAYQNALAILGVTGSVPADAGRTVADGIRQCRTALKVVTQPCPACKGTGRYTYRVEALAGEGGTREANGVACRTCGGSGHMPVPRGTAAVRILIEQSYADFALAARAAGRVEMGRAWVPADWPARLTLRQTAAVRRAWPPSCAACGGLGREDCRACGGKGRVPCNGEGCKQGWVDRLPSNTLTPKTALKIREPCPVCQGTANMPCAACRGEGFGVCRVCGSSGQLPDCRTCGGEGVRTCTRCKGAGVFGAGAACPDCRGQGLTLCPACHGDGCAKR
jgi:hypothetical protein